MLDFCSVLNLTTENYKEIFHASSQDLKKTIFLAALGIDELDEEDELRKSIVVDFCLDILSFSSNHGFSWENVHRSVSFGVRLLDETACKGVEIDDALQVFKDNIAKETTAFKDFEIKAIIDHFLSTLFRHYNLYLFCMTRDQEMDHRICELEVEMPFAVDKLSQGMEIEKWNYQQSLRKIEEEKQNLQTERLESLRIKKEQLDEEKNDALIQLEELHVSENTNGLPGALERLTRLHVESMESEIQNSVQGSKENMEYRVIRATITKPTSSKHRPTSRQRSKSKQKK